MIQACTLRGYDESTSSHNRGNFIEMIMFMSRLNVDILNVIFEKTPKNVMYTSSKIQKKVLHLLATKVCNKICDEVGNSKFCILVDEAKDASNKEQLGIVL